MTLLKRHRRGNYEDGETNATTYWFSVVKTAGEPYTIALKAPPVEYFQLPFEGAGDARRMKAKPAAKRIANA